LDLFKLKDLNLDGCDYLVPFLDSLSAFYSQNPGKLERLRLNLFKVLFQHKETVYSIETFLKTCPKLTELVIKAQEHESINKACILAHADTLSSLLLEKVIPRPELYFSVQDMASILKACSKLTQLATNFPAIDLGSITNLTTSLSFGRGDAGDMLEFENMLVSGNRNP
jgi:hypothetical protein